MQKQKIYFLVNPISGGKKKDNFHLLINKHLDTEKYDYDIEEWGKKDDVATLVKRALAKGFDIIVAVGGDGTINQVAGQLVGTNAIMGIIPMGSGNGFARHNIIPMDTVKAIKLLNSPTVIKVDTLSINNNGYVNIAGVGFDAHIGYLFSVAKKRGLNTYIKIVLRELGKFKPQQYKITIDGKQHTEYAFLISVANASQWGNNAVIAPAANIQDGKMDVVIMNPFKFYHLPKMAYQMFTKTIHKNKRIQSFTASNVVIHRENKGAVHFDGEPTEMGTELNFKLYPASLNLLV